MRAIAALVLAGLALRSDLGQLCLSLGGSGLASSVLRLHRIEFSLALCIDCGSLPPSLLLLMWQFLA